MSIEPRCGWSFDNPKGASVYAIIGRDNMVCAIGIEDKYRAWNAFFSYPVPRGNHAPMSEAIQAYEAIGYRCVRCRLVPADVPKEGSE